VFPQRGSTLPVVLTFTPFSFADVLKVNRSPEMTGSSIEYSTLRSNSKTIVTFNTPALLSWISRRSAGISESGF
jgi:hypothetical protein